jgi:hypothetical protein
MRGRNLLCYTVYVYHEKKLYGRHHYSMMQTCFQPCF